MSERPIGRCTGCGHHSTSFDDLNVECDACESGVVVSVAVQDWRQCPPCFGSGRSLLAADGPATCRVCRGCGWVTDADAREAFRELIAVAVAASLHETIFGGYAIAEASPVPSFGVRVVSPLIPYRGLRGEGWSSKRLAALLAAVLQIRQSPALPNSTPSIWRPAEPARLSETQTAI